MEWMPESSDLKKKVTERGIIYHYDPYTFNHSLRVAALACRIARSMSCDSGFINRTLIASILHDIGKALVPKTILNKPGFLTGKELRLMKLHTLLGYFSLSRYPVFDSVKQIVLSHHERYDGMGYPFGLKNDQISLEARIITVADTFDAITSNRVYQRALSVESAFSEINRYACSMFDPYVVDHFNSVVEALFFAGNESRYQC